MPFTLNVLSSSNTANFFTRISTAADGAQGNGDSYYSSFNSDGRYVVFTSEASNLVANDTNGKQDIFRKDLLTGQIVRVSTATDSTQADSGSYAPQITTDGRYVFFESFAGNLTVGDSLDNNDIFRKDLLTGELVCVSTAQGGAAGNASSESAHITPDGRYIVFSSDSSNLVAGDTNNREDIFCKDLLTGAVTLVSANLQGQQGSNPSHDSHISANGRYVIFSSASNNLVENDTNGSSDIFRKDLVTNEIVRVSTTVSGAQTAGSGYESSISADGRYVVFTSWSDALVAGDTNGSVDVFRKDLATGEVLRVSTSVNGTQGVEDSVGGVVSADGRYVVFTSLSYNLVAGDTNGNADVFRKDLLTGELLRLTDQPDGTQGNQNSGFAEISLDGRFIAFASGASNLVSGDSNGKTDIFVLDANLLPYRQAIAEKRFIDLKLGVGAASSVSVAWGDGAVDTVSPAGGSASFRHSYASTGSKAAMVTVKEGAQTWVVPHTITLSTGQAARNTALMDTLSGSAGIDTLTGDAFGNVLIGNGSNDMLLGGLGDDKLWGGAGKDVLTGGNGKDIFVFDARPNKRTNLDKVTDYDVRNDSIYLDNAVFTKLGKNGTLDAPSRVDRKFFAFDKAKDRNDYIVFNKKNGKVYYDQDGSGGKAMVEIATLKKNLKMTASEFFVI
ncbi:PD40 domain-containing protein [Microvirga aerophila]|nr:PD40 domain-containing protein [Microvirga aerophila]